MRYFACVLLAVVACKKSEPAKSADPAPPAGAAAAPAPTPAPTPAPAPKDPSDTALDAATAIFKAVTPITKEYGDAGQDCVKGVPEIEKVLGSMKEQIAAVQAVGKDAEMRKRFLTTYFKQDDSPFHDAKSDALGAALHCPKLVEAIEVPLGIPQPVDPAKAKK